MHLRDASESDLPAIVEIYNSTVPGRMVTADTEPVTVQQRRPWFAEHSSDRRPLWVLDVNGAVAAWLSFQSFYGRPAYNGTVEVSIYVGEQHRRRGYGRYLLGEAVQRSPGLGIRTLLGYIFSHNVPSLRLFEEFGFERWGYFPDIAVMDGIERSLSILGRRVA